MKATLVYKTENQRFYELSCYINKGKSDIVAEGRLIRVILDGIHAGISVCDADEIRRYNRCSLFETPTVHRLQHAPRLCGWGNWPTTSKCRNHGTEQHNEP